MAWNALPCGDLEIEISCKYFQRNPCFCSSPVAVLQNAVFFFTAID